MLHIPKASAVFKGAGFFWDSQKWVKALCLYPSLTNLWLFRESHTSLAEHLSACV